MIREENNVIISGTVAKEPEFDHEVYGERIYIFYLDTERISGVIDTIPISISERLYPLQEIEIGKRVLVRGEYRSHNYGVDKKKKLLLTVFCKDISEEVPDCDDDIITLNGYICKIPSCRETPLGRIVSDVLIAVNRPYGKSDYIPCIAWGRNARYISKLSVGSKITISGRIQSREYKKKIDNNEMEVRVAYEVSITRFREDYDESIN